MGLLSPSRPPCLPLQQEKTLVRMTDLALFTLPSVQMVARRLSLILIPPSLLLPRALLISLPRLLHQHPFQSRRSEIQCLLKLLHQNLLEVT
jgi:hypothetical protein